MQVMYIDGEMPAVTMQEHLAAIVSSHEAEAEADALLIVTPDMRDSETYARPPPLKGKTAIARPAGRRASDRGGQHHALPEPERKQVR